MPRQWTVEHRNAWSIMSDLTGFPRRHRGPALAGLHTVTAVDGHRICEG